MLKISLHGPFEHLQHKLWQKEGPRVKLAIWLLTIKSQESTQHRCMQVEWNTPLECSQGELHVFFKFHPNQRYEQRVMTSQSLGSPNRDNFGTLPWKSRDKKSFGCGCHGEAHTIWGKVVASPESEPWWVMWVQGCPWLVLAPKVLEKMI
jgi:hypothetical protein